jgi:hypothetical protein
MFRPVFPNRCLSFPDFPILAVWLLQARQPASGSLVSIEIIRESKSESKSLAKSTFLELMESGLTGEQDIRNANNTFYYVPLDAIGCGSRQFQTIAVLVQSPHALPAPCSTFILASRSGSKMSSRLSLCFHLQPSFALMQLPVQ